MARLPSLIARLFRRPAPPPDAGEVPLHPRFNARLREFQGLLGYTIRDRRLFARALMHRSSLQQRHHASVSNERLEFLGDSILNLIVGEYLYATFPRAAEGDLTKMRSRLVNRKALAAYARAIRLSDFVLTSPSASGTLGKGHDTITADCFEAVIAAIYLDGGFKAARGFVERRVLSALKTGDVVNTDDNYKSMLLEYGQARGLGIPRYAILSEEGPDHDRTFTVEVSLAGEPLGSGKGKNKKEAEQAAAEEAIDHIQDLPRADH
jgi:ribonuclease III